MFFRAKYYYVLKEAFQFLSDFLVQFVAGILYPGTDLDHLGVFGFIDLAQPGKLDFRFHQFPVKAADQLVFNEGAEMGDVAAGCGDPPQLGQFGVQLEPLVSGLEVCIIKIADSLCNELLTLFHGDQFGGLFVREKLAFRVFQVLF